eukprot:TRINITY_DN149_c0_g1_i3.p1 TRINITY_DN149_c0_g1~~TRINITY_DN149_c0_g1_i3.p1  ORF type:complete len:1360 (+),score=268.98 TRINITY_DN149_c0_g1_i3:559-4080(+)
MAASASVNSTSFSGFLPRRFSSRMSGWRNSTQTSGEGNLVQALRGCTTDWAVLRRAAGRLSDASYTLLDFRSDISQAVPELLLHPGGHNAGEESGALLHTYGSLASLYCLVRIGMDGKDVLSFGADESGRCRRPHGSSTEDTPRERFRKHTDWAFLEELAETSGLKAPPYHTPAPEDGTAGTPESRWAERVVALIALLAVRPALREGPFQPRLPAAHAPFLGKQAGTLLCDDEAFAYFVAHMTGTLPTIAGLSAAQRALLNFVCGTMDFNLAWLAQGEAPPGAVFGRCKAAVTSGHPADVAAYFAVWFANFAGGDSQWPWPGSARIVHRLSQARLRHCFDCVRLVTQRLPRLTETQAFEEWMVDRWERLGVGAPPDPQNGHVAVQRLTLMCPGTEVACVSAFQGLQAADRELLSAELARTGAAGQRFTAAPPGASQGPALMVHHAPRILQRAGVEYLPWALVILAEMLKAGRALFGLNSGKEGAVAAIRADILQDLTPPELAERGETHGWELCRVSPLVAVVNMSEGLARPKGETMPLHFPWPSAPAATQPAAPGSPGAPGSSRSYTLHSAVLRGTPSMTGSALGPEASLHSSTGSAAPPVGTTSSFARRGPPGSPTDQYRARPKFSRTATPGEETLQALGGTALNAARTQDRSRPSLMTPYRALDDAQAASHHEKRGGAADGVGFTNLMLSAPQGHIPPPQLSPGAAEAPATVKVSILSAHVRGFHGLMGLAPKGDQPPQPLPPAANPLQGRRGSSRDGSAGEPQLLVRLHASYAQCVVSEVQRHRGCSEHFTGDRLLSHFNVGRRDAAHARHCPAAALAIADGLVAVAVQARAEGARLQWATGMASGEAHVATLGFHASQGLPGMRGVTVVGTPVSAAAAGLASAAKRVQSYPYAIAGTSVLLHEDHIATATQQLFESRPVTRVRMAKLRLSRPFTVWQLMRSKRDSDENAQEWMYELQKQQDDPVAREVLALECFLAGRPDEAAALLGLPPPPSLPAPSDESQRDSLRDAPRSPRGLQADAGSVTQGPRSPLSHSQQTSQSDAHSRHHGRTANAAPQDWPAENLPATRQSVQGGAEQLRESEEGIFHPQFLRCWTPPKGLQASRCSTDTRGERRSVTSSVASRQQAQRPPQTPVSRADRSPWTAALADPHRCRLGADYYDPLLSEAIGSV